MGRGLGRFGVVSGLRAFRPSITVALELRATARVSGNGFQGSDFVPPAPTAVAIYAGQCSHKVVTATCITAA